MTRDEFSAGYLARQQAVDATRFMLEPFATTARNAATLDLADFLFDAFGTATGIATPREIPGTDPNALAQ